MKFIVPYFAFFFLALSGCSGGLNSQSEPVMLPTPFTGSMTAGTNTFLENGFSTPATAMPQKSAKFQILWTSVQDISGFPTAEFLTPLFQPTGMDAGTVSIDFTKAENIHSIENSTLFNVPFTITLNDGVSKVRADNMQIIYFPVSPDETAPLPDTPPDTIPVLSTGVGWGIVSEGAGIFADANAEGCSINYRFLSEFQMSSDGSLEPFATDHCECVVNCP